MISAPRSLRSDARRGALVLAAFGSLLRAGTVQAQQKDSIVARATAAIAPLRDTAALHAAGFSVIGVSSGSADLTPFQGQHWLSMQRFIANQPPELTKPEFMMYLPLGDSLVPIGVAYSQRIRGREPVPTTLAGTETEWHLHALCRGVPGEGIVLADGRENCVTRGGTPMGANIAMVHAWTIANPDGPYAHDNPALPYIATGLKPPAHIMSDERLLGVALGETYGAKLIAARHIDDLAARDGRNTAITAKRAALIALVPQLRAAERAGDAKRFASVRKQTIDAWNALADAYRAAAPTPEMKARFDVELKEATESMHHHM